MGKYIILDRDGVLVKDKGHVYKTEDLELMPGAVEGLKMLKNAGYKFIIISNQAGIAKGLYTRSDAKRFNNKLMSILASKNIDLEKIYFCEHHPEINGYCSCRKPAVGLAEKAASEFNINLNDSYFVGDKDSDIEFGKNCGGKTCLIDNGQYETSFDSDFRVGSLKEFAEIITKI